MSLFEIEQQPKKIFNPRYYQKEAVEKSVQSLEKTKKALCVVCTGGGKNYILNSVAKYFVENHNFKVLIICDRDELIDQLHQTAKDVLGDSIQTSLEKGKFISSRQAQVVVGSVQSLHKNRLSTFDKNQFQLLIIDECHKMMTPSYFRIIEYFNNLSVMGLTATPERGDDNELGDFFDEITYQYNLADGIRDGFLSPIKGKRITDVNIDISDLNFSSSGEFSKESEKQIEERVLKQIDAIAEAIFRETIEKKTLVFTVNVKIADILAIKLKKLGLKAQSLSYKTDKNVRKNIISDYKKSKITHLVNATLLSTGFDCPDINAVVLAKPTNSRVLLSQMIGRGTRICEGKTECTIYDFTFNSTKHSIATTWNLFQSGNIKFSEKIIERAKKKFEESPSTQDMFELLNKEKQNEIEESVKAAEKIKVIKKDSVTKLEFVEYDPLAITDFLDIDWNNLKWNNHKYRGYATEGMVNFLRKFKIKTPELLRKSQAAAMIDLIVQNGYSMRNIEAMISRKMKEESEKLALLRLNRKEREE